MATKHPLPGNSQRVKSEVSDIRIRIKIGNAIYKVKGISGRDYVFSPNGDIQDVDPQDVDFLLSKKARNSCCGSEGGKLFELVE